MEELRKTISFTAIGAGVAHHAEAPEFSTLGPDLPAPAQSFVHLARAARQWPDRTTADYCAAYGSEAHADGDLIEDTALRTMSGAGHQHFLEFMRDIVGSTTSDHIRAALFAVWTYSDPRPSMRWDPQDDRRYALRASDPAGGQSPITTVRGANCLAIEALPCFPTMPTNRDTKTRAFRGTTFCWPIWNVPISLDCVQSLLAHAELTEESPRQQVLHALGVVEIFRSRRVTTGRFRNFTAAVACWGYLPTDATA
jgi:hypothetical protein